MRNEPGFTLIELMIVVAIIAVIATIALPNLLASRLSANESGAISTLRSFYAAQTSFKEVGLRDQDQLPPNNFPDGNGEYGGLQDLTGTISPANSGPNPPAPLTPAVIPQVFAIQDQPGDGLPAPSRNGYWYRIYLPDQNGAPVGEPVGGYALDPAAANFQEVQWVAYAWPVEVGGTGTRTFVIDATGEVHQTSNDGGAAIQYGGASAPAGDAAFQVGGNIMPSVAGQPNGIAANNVGNDGNLWTSVGN